jgi:hypothetical protein
MEHTMVKTSPEASWLKWRPRLDTLRNQTRRWRNPPFFGGLDFRCSHWKLHLRGISHCHVWPEGKLGSGSAIKLYREHFNGFTQPSWNVQHPSMFVVSLWNHV